MVMVFATFSAVMEGKTKKLYNETVNFSDNSSHIQSLWSRFISMEF